ncbi:MAG: non-heme iron oxygenase ferredoxin subunit [Chloroflexi bacterium]|nr:non-heme iron oxygenase ferredoxin subunit [Chloroflexota bacterium]
MSEWIKVAELSELIEGEGKEGRMNGEEIAIFNVDGHIYVTHGECTHEGAPIGTGFMEGEIVTCPWHYSMFNVRTGEVLEGPAKVGLKCFTVKIEGNTVYAK